jgi:hypothetical protein
MTKFRFAPVVAAVCAVFGSTGVTNAQVVTQWNFNAQNTNANVGSGTVTLLGTTVTFAVGTNGGGSSDPVVGSTNNFAYNTTSYPTQGAGSGTEGVRFDISTTGKSNLVFRFDQRFSISASRFFRVDYTINGTDFIQGPSFSAGFGGDNFYNNRTLDLSGIAGANNNGAFGVRVVSIFEPNTSAYAAAQPGINYDTTGTARFDMVTLTAGAVFVGGGVDTSLATPGNFSSGAAPDTTGTVLLGAAAGANTTVTTAPGGTTLDQLVIRTGAPAFTLGGAGALTLSAGLVNSAANAQTIAAPVTFGQSNTIQNNGAVNLTGTVNFTSSLNLQGSGLTTLNGAVLGASNANVTQAPTPPTIRVAADSALAGVGTIGAAGTPNNVQVFAGGAIRGGDGAGSAAERVGFLTVNGNVTINSTATANGILRVEASRNTGTTQVGNSNADSSVLSVTGGTLHFVPDPGTKFTIDVVSGTNPLVEGETYTIQLAGVDAVTNLQLNGSSIGGNQTIAATNYTLTSAQFSFSNVSLTTNSSGTALFVTFTAAPVPEPTTVLALAAGAMAVGRAVRRTRSREFA